MEIRIERGGAGLFHATSPQMPELFVSGETVEEIREAVPVVVDAILEAKQSSTVTR